jgi:hypothetical protein
VTWAWIGSRSDTFFPVGDNEYQIVVKYDPNSPDNIVDFVVVDLQLGREGETAAEQQIKDTFKKPFAQRW